MYLIPAGVDDVDAFVALLEDAAQWMVDRGIEQWRPGAMAAQRTMIVDAQSRGELLVVREAGRVVGGVVLRAEADPIWMGRPADSALYLSKLVVARSRIGERLGERILAGAEGIATDRAAGWLRLDCVATNHSLARYYQRLGYYPRETVVGRLLHDKKITQFGGVVIASLDAVDFEHWQPDRFATLMFVVRRGEVLLIRKKRGHGAGKINGPGGMVESGETPLQCALREIEEEVGVRALDVTPLAELRFQDTDGSSMLGYAFKAGDCLGEPHETAEAAPFWCPLDAIPYTQMWEDDLLWLPYLLEGSAVSGEFLMHADRLIAHRLRSTPSADLLRGATQRTR